MADAQSILKRMEEIFNALRDGTATNLNSLANIRSHVVGMEADLEAVSHDVEALKSAHPSA